ncbi:MAG: LPS export ABC transporter permease LptG [Neomegalonema sp.]
MTFGPTLSLYIARRFFGAVIGIFCVVLFLAGMFDAIELIRRVGANEEVPLDVLFGMAMLRAPSIALKAAPFVMLLAAMWTYARLARGSELVVARAGGGSAWGVAIPSLVTAALIGAVATGVYSPIAAALLDLFDRLEAQIFKSNASLLSISDEGLWLRQGGARGQQSVIHAQASNADGTRLGNVTIFLLRQDDELLGRIAAANAVLQPPFWRLEEAIIHEINGEDPEAPPTRTAHDVYDLATDLTSEQIVESFAAPETIPVWRLPTFIRNLEEAGFSARRHILHFHAALAAPLLFASMTLLGGAFSMRHARLGGLGEMALFAALTGFLVYFVFDIAHALAGSGVIPPHPAAWGPPMAAFMLAAGLLLHFEDG